MLPHWVPVCSVTEAHAGYASALTLLIRGTESVKWERNGNVDLPCNNVHVFYIKLHIRMK